MVRASDHAWREGLPLVPDDEVKEVLGEMSPSGLQGAAQLLTAMAEGAGEVEIFIATRDRGQVRPLSSQPPSQSPQLCHTISLVKLLWLSRDCIRGHGQDGQMGAAEVCSGRSDSIWIPLPSFRLHAGSWFFFLLHGEPALQPPPSSQLQPTRVGCAFVHMRR